MSRKDHKKHDAELERRHKIEAELQRQSKAFRLRWADALAVVGVLLAVAGLTSEDMFLPIFLFIASGVVISVSVYTHRELKSWRFAIVLLVVGSFSALSVRAYSKAAERELNSLHGRLFPSDEATPPNDCSTLYSENSGGVFILLGFATSYVDQFPHTVISVDDQPRLVVHRDPDKSIWISLEIFGADGKIIADLDKDGFTVREGSYFKFIRKDRSSLAIIDEYKQEVLDVRYVNRSAIWINAVLRYPGSNPVVFRGSEGGGICTAHSGKAEIEFTTRAK